MATNTNMKALIGHEGEYYEEREVPYPLSPILEYAGYVLINCAWLEGLETPKITPHKIKRYYLHKIELDPNTYRHIAIYTENNMANSTYQDEINKYYISNLKNLYDNYIFGKSTSTCTKNDSQLLSNTPQPTEKNMYNRLTNIAKRLLNKEVKTLIEAGFMNQDLSMTEAGRQELTSILFEKYQKELVEAATAKLEEDKENK